MGVKEPEALVTADHAGAAGDPNLYAAALRVLIGNWRGHATVPSRGLYPHQWSWDSAFVVLGLQHWAPGRAAAELLSLFGGQWADGRVPHIVFNPAVANAAYFPGPSFWRSATQPGAPPVATSGLIQPPVHAAAAAGLINRLGSRGSGFARRIYPHLVAQNSYLRQRRTVAPSGLAVVLHPWESGMDNSPAWDTPLARVPTELTLLNRYTRRDLQHAGNGERPTDADYARYVRLALAYRDSGYDDDWAREESEFVVLDPAFNALWAWSELALAGIAATAGHDGKTHLAEAARITAALHAHLYHPEARLFLARDHRTAATLPERTVSGLIPLLLPDLHREVVAALVDTLASPVFAATTPAVRGVPSFDRTDERYDPRRYWRGPSWVNTTWLVTSGLRAHGYRHEAAKLDNDLVTLICYEGFREYFNPDTGTGHGATDFSWSAALLIHLLAASDAHR